jgi:hypothetical protein
MPAAGPAALFGGLSKVGPKQVASAFSFILLAGSLLTFNK